VRLRDEPPLEGGDVTALHSILRSSHMIARASGVLSHRLAYRTYLVRARALYRPCPLAKRAYNCARPLYLLSPHLSVAEIESTYPTACIFEAAM
jgi:hypothetical protein